MTKKTFANTGAVKPVQARGILKPNPDIETTAKPPKKKVGGRPPRSGERASEKVTLNLTPAQKAKALESANGTPLSLYIINVLSERGVI